MKYSRKDNNNVEIRGVITSDFKYSHTSFGEDYYKFYVVAERHSKTADCIRCLVSSRMFDVKQDCKCMNVHIVGEYRSRNIDRHTILSVFVQDLIVSDKDDMEDYNYIELDGYLCKEPVYRQTPFGREITDFHLAINTTCGRSYYIPCIAWGRNARYLANAEVSTRVRVKGRIQSREYPKKYDNGTEEVKTAWEVSVCYLEVCDEESNIEKS